MQIPIWGMQNDKIRICTLVCTIRQRLIIHIHPLYTLFPSSVIPTQAG